MLSEFTAEHFCLGLDIDFNSLTFAKQNSQDLGLLQGDGYQLPIQSNTFDLSFCHYLLLWLKKPQLVIKGLLRVTKPGGWIGLFAEPDYQARLDAPPPLDQLGKHQNKSLQKQGVNLNTGRQLGHWLQAAGLTQIQSGLLGGHWQSGFNQAQWALEWETIFHDLSDNLYEEAIKTYQNADKTAYKNGSRVLFIPTFYAWGRKQPGKSQQKLANFRLA